jgi:hypothetical protein
MQVLLSKLVGKSKNLVQTTNNKSHAMKPEDIEQILKLHAWGIWARPYYGLGVKPQGWAKYCKPRYPRENKPPPEINDDEGILLDRNISTSLDEEHRKVVLSYYVYAPHGIPSERATARFMRMSRSKVRRLREDSLQKLWESRGC